MNTIGNKMFAYIDNHNGLTQSMINQYNDSLIFIGDEKQIFVPVINTYVGIGQSAYTYLLNRISNANDNLDEYNKYIHKDTVTGIYAEFSPTEIETALRSADYIRIRNHNVVDASYFKANTDLVLKGLNDYNLQNHLDELGRPVETTNTSGITVNIAHNGEVHKGYYTINGKQYTYSYYNPYDVITIDDTKTWSYIKASNTYLSTYLSNFAMRFAVDQADQVYKNILGINDGQGNIYIEKEFAEAFNYDSVTKTLTAFTDVYIRVADESYQQVSVQNQSGVGYAVIYHDNNNNHDYVIYYTNLVPNNNKISINNTSYDILNGNNLKNKLDQNGDGTTFYGYYIDSISGDVIPRWYHRDSSNTSSSYINIADGIQTLKEVAYILDLITDGDQPGYDTGIQLAYNIATNYDEIQKLKTWQNNIGNETVSSFKSESGTELLTVNYYSTNLWDKDRDGDDASIGKVKLDLDLRLAQTYVLNGVTYAAYLSNHPGANKTYFIYKGDRTNVENYIQLTGSNNAEVKELLQSQNPSISTIEIKHFLYEDPDDNTKVTGIETESTISIDNIGSISGSNKYIYFPYEKCYYDFTKGLTDVKWVTSYVSYVNNYLNDRINTLDVSGQIDNKIDSLDALSYTKLPGQFVTHVTEENGKISVYQETLPLDHILKNDIFYTDDIYIHISTALAQTSDYKSSIYKLENNIYTQIDPTGKEDNFYDNLYYKTKLSTMTPVPASTSINAMILNSGNTSYYIKKTGTNKDEYLPIDIHAAYTGDSGRLFNANGTVKTDAIYYLATKINNAKYFDASTIQLNNGSTTTLFTSYITYLSAADEQNTGLTDAWDVRRTIESMFQWVNLKTNKIIG